MSAPRVGARICAVIYDLDGTLIDSRGDLASSVNAMLGRLQLPEREEKIIHGFIGEGAENLVKRSLGAGSEQLLPEALPIWREEYANRLLQTTRLYDGVAAMLGEPPEARGVLTNKPGHFAREILDGLGVAAAFRAVVGGDEARRKPSPDGLLSLCEKLSASPSETLFVGDSPIDLRTGRAALVSTCAVTWGLTERAALREADYLCDTPAELAALLRRLHA
jgi:phosphoglycolate phosphatase